MQKTKQKNVQVANEMLQRKAILVYSLMAHPHINVFGNLPRHP